MNISIKICGLTNEAALQSVMTSKADYVGFVYYPSSPRHIPIERAVELKALLPDSVKVVSVLVDPDDELLDNVCGVLKPDYLQLHGRETPQRIQAIRSGYLDVHIIKALKVSSSDDIAEAMAYVPCVDMLLFDAKPPALPGMMPGGNGLSFDWNLLRDREFSIPWFLSGGLHSDNILKAIQLSGAKNVDISSGVERSPGVKDPALISAFIDKVRSI